MTLVGKQCVITGGSSGIGLATAELLSARGAIVHVLSRTPPPDSAEGLSFVRCDVESEQQIKEAFDVVITAAGQVDVLVNNAEHSQRIVG